MLSVLSAVQRDVRRTYADTWSWMSVIWTTAVFLLCPVCAYFTMGAVLCNIFAYVDHKASRLRHCASTFSSLSS